MLLACCHGNGLDDDIIKLVPVLIIGFLIVHYTVLAPETVACNNAPLIYILYIQVQVVVIIGVITIKLIAARKNTVF